MACLGRGGERGTVHFRPGQLARRRNDRDVAVLLWRRAQELNPYNEAVKANLEMVAGE